MMIHVLPYPSVFDTKSLTIFVIICLAFVMVRFHVCQASADDYAPPRLRSLWLSIFYMAIPVGYAVGYIFGGIVGSIYGWRIAFLLEASFMLPFVIFSFSTTPIPLGNKSQHSSNGAVLDERFPAGQVGDSVTEPVLPSVAALVTPSQVWIDFKVISQCVLLQ